MSTAEETIKSSFGTQRRSKPIVNRALDFFSSVRFGVFQLCLLVLLAMAGMLILQQNVPGFDAYYPSLTPAERMVFGSLGLFDIYHSWYFNFLLLSLSLNIILASIDRFPTAWSYLREPKVTATADWLRNLKDNAVFPSRDQGVTVAAERIKTAFESNGLKAVITETENISYSVDSTGKKDFTIVNNKPATVVFGQSGTINRLGAYIVHVALLTLFLGNFVFFTTSFDADVRMIPGEKTDQIEKINYNLDKKERYTVKLPFTMECTDIQQRLINEKGSIDVTNTMDWRTQLKIDDPQYGITVEDASLNKPLMYRGYRFFQAQTIPIGHARTINLELTPQNGGEPIHANIARNGSTTLPDGTKVDFADFQPDFTFGQDGKPDTKSGDYNNPVAVLNVTPPAGEKIRVFAFAQKLADNIPVGAPKAGYKWRLAEFEKTPLAHILSIKFDPYNASIIAWYFGGFGLVGALIFVFFFSHKRVWAHIETNAEGKPEIVLGGEANRNQIAFSDKFNKIADELRNT
ncbi:MAG: cytochrome c biogenesis protein ResB [Acidobacteriota bacterium]